MEIAAELVARPILVAPRFLFDDCTPEKLASLLAQHGGRMAILSPEGGIIELMAGRYSDSRASNLGVYLKAHAADDESAAGDKPVHVEPLSYAHVRALSRRDASGSIPPIEGLPQTSP